MIRIKIKIFISHNASHVFTSRKNNGMDASKDYGFVELEITGQTRLQLETDPVCSHYYFFRVHISSPSLV